MNHYLLFRCRWVVVVVSGRTVEYNSLVPGAPWVPLPNLLNEHNNSVSVGMDGDSLVVAGGVNRNNNPDLK